MLPVAPEPDAASPAPSPAEPGTPKASPIPLEATPEPLAATPGVPAIAEASPVATETPPGVEAITVEAMTSDREVRPGEPSHYRFQLTNTTGVPMTVQPFAVNSLPGWTGRLLHADGATALAGPVTIGPWQSTIVVIAVTVPADARVGDQNMISLRLEPAMRPIVAEEAGALAPPLTLDTPRDGPA